MLASSTSFSIFCFSKLMDHCKRSNLLLAFSSACFITNYLEFSTSPLFIYGRIGNSRILTKRTFSGSDPTALLEVSEDDQDFKLTSSSSGKFSIKNELIDFLICITRNWVFVFPSPWPGPWLLALNLYFPAPALICIYWPWPSICFLPDLLLNLCLPVLFFTVKVCYSYSVYLEMYWYPGNCPPSKIATRLGLGLVQG